MFHFVEAESVLKEDDIYADDVFYLNDNPSITAGSCCSLVCPEVQDLNQPSGMSSCSQTLPLLFCCLTGKAIILQPTTRGQ